ncbi:DUF4391 domain-containing protein [Sulfurimonas paralvinellae]|uniref:DUF4391 domain-containing protein n=1 Tax=Sulfurimonas paralvinellae TaxID=317658 RepID=A0A7M1B7C1_9BACT|nr:DUF4391 domain-containing protein [Sulfurimonas paralvinellae]QOP45545.1 DUF4391 domain-containing protein [Sulfurimonas paralvinellae]
MIQEPIHNLKIPHECKIGKRLTKKQFLENFSLKANEKKILKEDIQSITLEYLLNKHNINIAPFVDEENDYSEIAFIQVEILNQSKLKSIATIVQYIPYPLIVFFIYKNSLCINISPKRINKNDSTKLAVEESYFTNWIDLEQTNSLEEDFLKSLEIQNHPFTDFLSFYNSFLDKIVAFNASAYSGSLSVNEETKTILDEIAQCETKITELKNKIKKETNFSDKVNMNIELKKMKNKINDLKGKL